MTTCRLSNAHKYFSCVYMCYTEGAGHLVASNVVSLYLVTDSQSVRRIGNQMLPFRIFESCCLTDGFLRAQSIIASSLVGSTFGSTLTSHQVAGGGAGRSDTAVLDSITVEMLDRTGVLMFHLSSS